MKRTLLAFALMLAAFTSFAQAEFAPPGATWGFTYKTFWTSFNGFFVVKYEADTIISNLSFKRLHTTVLDSSLTEIEHYNYFVRQSGDSIFVSFGHNEGYFAFKNNYILNETVNFDDFLWGYPLTVEAIEPLTYGNQSINKYTLDSGQWPINPTTVYERFGPELGFFQSWWGVAVDGESFKLLCYKDDEFPLSEIGNGPCFGLTPTFENVEETVSLSISPNPASQEITLDFLGKNIASMNVTVFELAGRMLIQTPLSTHRQLDVSNLPSGIYIGIATADGQTMPFKFVKQ